MSASALAFCQLSLMGISVSAGGAAGLALPYRSQESSQPLPEAELEAVPPGPCRAILQRHRMMRSITSCAGPQPHASLALPAYVQMSSPIRRHGDLLTHYQLKVREASALVLGSIVPSATQD